MNQRLIALFSMRIKLIEKGLKFVGAEERIERFHTDMKTAVEGPSSSTAVKVENVLSYWEGQLFDNPKVLEFVNAEQTVHPLLSGLLK